MIKIITEFLKKINLSHNKIEPLIGDGSNRKFFRIYLKKSSLILILPQEGKYGLKEACSYYELGKFFYKNNIPVPKIEFFDHEKGILLVEDLGNIRLFDIKDFSHRYYKESIQILIKFQKLVSLFPIEKTLDNSVYDFNFLWEKEIKYFLDWYMKKYKKIILPDSFIKEIFYWAKEEAKFIDQVVMHRDFQSKNLMIKNNRIYLIDFQGARIGPPSYDLVSLLHDPYVRFFNDLKTISLWIEYYLEMTDYSANSFFKEFYFLSIVRLMQALAAYCKLSILGKHWFKTYIPIAEKKLFYLMYNLYPKLYKTFKEFL
ncbi:aminoglycoside phosphotransferase family protein [Thermodesulfobacterium hydrogeniphilum]|uniref:aminoglycoside phosphotransferase family protein n=1 Tax=Thermodesulfobacterium hydrogeniphilum TaxID=161156 RepID=UPI000570B4C3|nr:phosphotransferase [Thermodesulfobacterium hydrogeniphilum]